MAAIGWGVFLLGSIAFTAWDWIVGFVRHAPARALSCFEPRALLLLAALAVCLVLATSALTGVWGVLLRIFVVLGQLWLAMVLEFFVLEPLQAATGVYAGHVCGDL
jgi:hypothetical protein